MPSHWAIWDVRYFWWNFSVYELCLTPTVTTCIPFHVLQSRFVWSYIIQRSKSDCTKSLYEPPRDKTNKMACAPREDSDQPGHPPAQSDQSHRNPHEESLVSWLWYSGGAKEKYAKVSRGRVVCPSPSKCIWLLMISDSGPGGNITNSQ